MPRKKSTVAFVAALAVFVGAFSLIVLLMSTGTHADLIGFVLYVSGPLPIVPGILVAVGLVLRACGD